jgi:hypothetical protein
VHEHESEQHGTQHRQSSRARLPPPATAH